jgi:hypothetical protein
VLYLGFLLVFFADIFGYSGVDDFFFDPILPPPNARA